MTTPASSSVRPFPWWLAVIAVGALALSGWLAVRYAVVRSELAASEVRASAAELRARNAETTLEAERVISAELARRLKASGPTGAPERAPELDLPRTK